MRDRPKPPPDAEILAQDAEGRAAIFQVAENSLGFCGHPGFKTAMAEDLIMEFEEVPDGTASGLEQLRGLQPRIEDQLVPLMTGLVQCTSLMSSPKAGLQAAQELDKQVI